MRNTLLGPWVRRFLMEYLIEERNFARNTQQSYRDTLRLLLPLVARWAKKAVDRLSVLDLSAERVRRFLGELETTRRCCVATRNQRLAAIHALARFVGLHAPEFVAWCGEIRKVPFKKAPRPLIPYLEQGEMDALLAVPDRKTAQGQRDYALLLFLYNTGARSSEAAHIQIADVNRPSALDLGGAAVRIHGKGNKKRWCPLWTSTVQELTILMGNREPSERVFLNRYGRPLTRFGIHTLVERSVARAASEAPTLMNKRVSPHVIRHTTATHLLRSGVDINTIRGWLGHVSVMTTNLYAEVDLEMKAKALANCEVADTEVEAPWQSDPGVMEFLQNL